MNPGRYEVLWKIWGGWRIVLEKTINKKGEGQNHPPVFLARHINLPFMDFDVSIENETVVFTYRNGLIIDKLKRIKNKEEWIGELYYKGKLFDIFIFRRKK